MTRMGVLDPGIRHDQETNHGFHQLAYESVGADSGWRGWDAWFWLGTCVRSYGDEVRENELVALACDTGVRVST
jgi:hypothetical protein